MKDTITAPMRRFAKRYGSLLAVAGIPWRYYRLGEGPAVVWLTGGLRRAAFGHAFMELLSRDHTVVALDYPAVLRTVDEFDQGLCAILDAEGIQRFDLGGQSYGGLLAQAFLARHPDRVGRLVLSSTGPADFGRGWLPVEYAITALVRVLPERGVKRAFARVLDRVISGTPEERQLWSALVRDAFEHDLTRDDVISHFAVVADAIRTGAVRPGVFRGWPGRAVVLRARNDPTQHGGDLARYRALFGRPVEVVDMGQAGHTAALSDPEQFASWVHQALTADPGTPAREGGDAG